MKAQCLFVCEAHYRLQDSANGFKDAPTLEGRLLNVTMSVYQQQLVNLNSCLSTAELQPG